MASIITNNASMAALQTLRSIGGSLDQAQQQVSTGLRVAKASDDAAYWSISTSMRSDKGAMEAVSDSMAMGKAVLDVTYNGMSEIRDELTTIRNLVITASSLPPPATNGYSNYFQYQPDATYDQTQVGQVDAEIHQHWQQINAIVESSSFSGVNLLKNDATEPALPGSTTKFVAGYANGQVLTISIDNGDVVMMNANRSQDAMYGQPGSENQGYLDGTYWGAAVTYPLTYVDTNGAVVANSNTYTLRNQEVAIANSGSDRKAYYQAFINQIDQRITGITSGMSVVGSTQKRLAIQDEFNNSMIDNVSKGVGRLVDADMEQSSAKLAALQTQQQLAVQSLNIANQSPNNIMTLFR